LKAACERLSFAGVPLGNQSVLLKGVNDDAEVMKHSVCSIATAHAGEPSLVHRVTSSPRRRRSRLEQHALVAERHAGERQRSHAAFNRPSLLWMIHVDAHPDSGVFLKISQSSGVTRCGRKTGCASRCG